MVMAMGHFNNDDYVEDNDPVVRHVCADPCPDRDYSCCVVNFAASTFALFAPFCSWSRDRCMSGDVIPL